jgi:hypothetical protein
MSIIPLRIYFSAISIVSAHSFKHLILDEVITPPGFQAIRRLRDATQLCYIDFKAYVGPRQIMKALSVIIIQREYITHEDCVAVSFIRFHLVIHGEPH